jgi:hypothetical protein
MRIIAHRGNLDGPDPTRENSPIYVMAALAAGVDVEVDLWLVGTCGCLVTMSPSTSLPLVG